MNEKDILFSSELDQQFLDELYQGDADYAVIVFANFLEEMPPMLNDCVVALKGGDIPAFKKAVHKVKPVFSYVGLTGISAGLERLEQECMQRTAGELEGIFDGIRNEISQALPVVEKERIKLEAITKNR